MHNIVEISDACNIWNFIFLLIGNLIGIYELGTHLDDDFLSMMGIKNLTA